MDEFHRLDTEDDQKEEVKENVMELL